MFDLTRDNARTPMQWDDSKYAGFSNVEPWIKVNENKDSINVNEDLKSERSINKFYRNLISFRKDNEVIKLGEYICLNPNDSNIYIYKRKLGDKEIVVVSNFKGKQIESKLLNELANYKLVISNFQNNSNILEPYETRVYKNY